MSVRRSNVRCGLAASLAALLALVAPHAAGAQSCPPLPGNAFAFLYLSLGARCPASPIVRFAAPGVVFDCGFFTQAEHAIECGASPAECAQICRDAADIWNADLPGHFTFVPAGPSTPVGFCNNDDGRTSVGGSTTICDGSKFGANVLAVTLRFVNPTTGEQLDADVVVNPKFNGTFDTRLFQAVVGHELGHVIGLDHPDQCTPPHDAGVVVLMHSTIQLATSDPCFIDAPTADDITGAKLIFPRAQVCGDADGDGNVNSSDSVQMLRAAIHLDSACTLASCDMTGDGVVNSSDAVQALRAAVHLSFGSNCPAA